MSHSDKELEHRQEAERIMTSCAQNPRWHGSCHEKVVNFILESCGGDIMCQGQLRYFDFRRITSTMYSFRTKEFKT